MEADMKTSNLINRLVLVDAILTMTLGLGLGLTAPALVLGGLVPVAWCAADAVPAGDGPGADVPGRWLRRKQRSQRHGG
jgi:hypothetical protein